MKPIQDGVPQCYSINRPPFHYGNRSQHHRPRLWWQQNDSNSVWIDARSSSLIAPLFPLLTEDQDINNAGDGGIYAELIQNRAFQGSPKYPVSLSGWSSVNGAALSIKNLSQPLSAALPSSLNVAPGNTSSGIIGFKNSGFWGIDVRVQKYTGSFYVRGAYNGSFTASLTSALTNETFGSVSIPSKSKRDEWTQHKFTLVPERDAPNSNNSFAITFSNIGATRESLDFNLISLFPPTYKGRENGLRIDIAEAFEALNPVRITCPTNLCS